MNDLHHCPICSGIGREPVYTTRDRQCERSRRGLDSDCDGGWSLTDLREARWHRIGVEPGTQAARLWA